MVKQAYGSALRSLWTGRADITVYDGAVNPANGRTQLQERVAASGLPCRIAYSTSKRTEPYVEAALVSQLVTLHIDPEVEIPEGSKVTVVQNGTTGVYERSGKPAVYSHHQEVPLKLLRQWA